MKTREEWLNALTKNLAPEFKKLGFALPKKLRISCGWPLGKALPDAKGNRHVGQCFPPEWSKDRHYEIFISPCLSKIPEVGATLVHELVHAAVGVECGHKGDFKRVAIDMGLQGPMRSTKAGKELKERLNTLSKEIGEYPHQTLDVSKRKKQGTRLLKLTCFSCGYTVRTTHKWIVQGLPICCCGGDFEII